MAMASCGDPVTQVVIRIDMDSNLEIPCDLRNLSIEIPGVDDAKITDLALTNSTELPLQVTLVDGPKSPVTVTIYGYKSDAATRTLEQRVVLPGFQSGKSLLANVTLTNCGLDCDDITMTEADLKTYAPVASGNRHNPTVCTSEPERCSNGEDDDADGLIDGDDPDCATSEQCVPGCTGEQACYEGTCRDVKV
ncbi:MAG: hypothetical protein KC417_10880, partial [Myxococcales bacterium]|nr:hypothetical protein [Myxococcales bacterium]